VRNYLAFGRPVVGTTLAGYNLLRQNYLISGEDYFRYNCGSAADSTIHALISRREDVTGKENEAQMDALYRHEAVGIIGDHPVRYALLSGHRFALVWFNWHVPEDYGLKSNISDYAVMVGHLILLVGVIMGLRGRLRDLWPLATVVAAFTFIHMAVAGRMYYTLDIVPVLLPIAVIGLLKVGSTVKVLPVVLSTGIVLAFAFNALLALGRIPLPAP
jgi:hypothetical protein